MKITPEDFDKRAKELRVQFPNLDIPGGNLHDHEVIDELAQQLADCPNSH